MLKKILTLTLLSGLAIFSACTSGYVTETHLVKELNSYEDDRPIVVYSSSDDLPDSAIYVGEIEITPRAGGGGFLPDYLDYKVKDFGANAIQPIPGRNFAVVTARMFLCPPPELYKKDMKQNEVKALVEELKKSTDPYEGIYESRASLIVPENDGEFCQLACKKNSKGDYDLIYLQGKFNNNYFRYSNTHWGRGDIFGHLKKTQFENTFMGIIYKSYKVFNTPSLVRYDNGSFYIHDFQLRKIVPTKSAINKRDGSLTSFYIGNNRILTCAHGVKGSFRSYKVRGLNGDMTKVYSVSVEKIDEYNDLAILKINDAPSLGDCPFSVANNDYALSEEIFVLGYPLSNVMGNSIKFTSGAVSSKIGYNDNPFEFQFSAPVQPGNSGSPVFDASGQINGVVSSGMISANNVGYAVKSSILRDFLNGSQATLSKENNKTLSVKDRIETIKKYIYLVEIYDEMPAQYFDKYPSDRTEDDDDYDEPFESIR